MPVKPTSREKDKYLAKIEEWRGLGFYVEGLEDLLENDFEGFKKRRLEILRGQIGETPEKGVMEEPKIEKQEMPDEIIEEEVIEEPATIMVGDEAEEEPIPVETIPSEKEDLKLIGKPLPVEPPPPDDEDTILIAEPEDEEDIVPIKKKKVAKGVRIRELEAKEDERAERKEVEEEIVEEEEGEAEVPERMLGLEAPPEKKKEEKEKKAIPKKERYISRVRAIQIASVIVAGIVIMAILFWMIYAQSTDENGGNGNGLTEIDAVINADKTSGVAGETFNFNAEDSEGDIDEYSWVFDADFIITSGSSESLYVTGYFGPTEGESKEYSVTLTVQAPSGQVDTDTLTVTINPLEVSITEEKLGDSAKYRVNGEVTITNPGGTIASVTQPTGSELLGDVIISIDEIIMIFQNKSGEPMTTKISDTGDMKNGFMNEHEVYLRHIQQDLDISGFIHATIESEVGAFSTYDDNMEISGTMDSDEKSYTDYSTGHTIQIQTTNDLDISSTVDIEGTASTELPIKSTDSLTSFPDLRQEPTKLRLKDLSDDPVGLDDEDTVIYGSVAYSWHAIATDQVLGTPALKLEFFLDSATLEANNIDEFTMFIWLGDGKPVPLKSEVHVELISEGNQVVMDYSNILTEYTAGSTSIDSKTCEEEFDSTHHYPEKFPLNSTMQDEFTDDWNYLPNLTKTNLQNSFSRFSPDLAMAWVMAQTGFTDFLAENPGAFVVNGNCSEQDGELLWNLTFGSEDSTAGYNVLVGKSGVKHEIDEEIEAPNNSTNDFWPILTFAGSEYILKDYNDEDINLNIFKNDRINFEEVVYGITAGLDYPTVDLTSVTNFQTSRLSYYAIVEEDYGWFSCAMDAETGQLMFKWDHQYAGIELPY